MNTMLWKDNKRYMKNKWKVIGQWHSRRVYNCKSDDEMIIKRALNVAGIFWNLLEYETYTMLRIWWIEDIPLAPVYDVSDDWVWLYMHKAEMVDEVWTIHSSLKSDVKPENFWKIWDRVVKIDYWLLPPRYFNRFLYKK